jgi:CRISPR-associated protein Csb2
MLAIAFNFTAGRYHATPWGHHVNEGHIEWPPAPWRLLRALVAAAYKLEHRIQWPEVRALLTGPLSHPPEYILPPTTAGHTRHYMPTAGNPTLVFDRFLTIGQGAGADTAPSDTLTVLWPGTTLTGTQNTLLDTLLSGIAYLGRAEGWTEAHRLTAAELAERPPPHAIPDDAKHPHAPGELIRLQTLADQATFDQQIALYRKQLKGAALKRLPATRFDGLLVDIGQLRKDGWSAPPASTWQTYRITPPTQPQVQAHDIQAATGPYVAIYALHCAVQQRLEQTVSLAEQVHRTLLRFADSPPPAQLTGRGSNGAQAQSHQHAYYLPVDDDGDGKIDHLLVYSRQPFTPATDRALRRLRVLYRRDADHHVTVALEAIGPINEYRDALRCLRTARTWTSATPFVMPKFPKKGPAGRAKIVTSECQHHHHPAPTTITHHSLLRLNRGGRTLQWHRFKRWRATRRPPAKDTGYGFRLEFEHPVSGPIALGYASHYGLGQFVPQTDE